MNDFHVDADIPVGPAQGPGRIINMCGFRVGPVHFQYHDILSHVKVIEACSLQVKPAVIKSRDAFCDTGYYLHHTVINQVVSIYEPGSPTMIADGFQQYFFRIGNDIIQFIGP